MGKGVELTGKNKEKIYPVTASDLVYDKDTKQNIKTSLANKVEEAPKDGKQYARINGVWAPIESGNALDPMLPVLSLTIGSSIENDATIARVSALVSYADKEFMLGNGGKMNVPYGLDVTVTFPNVDNYSTPDVVVFEDVQSDIAAEGTYINLQEVVNVYVSADDGSAVDGQVLTVGRLSRRPNGVYIEDKNGKLWTKDEWDGSVEFSSLAIVHNEHSFGLHPTCTYEAFGVLYNANVGTAEYESYSAAAAHFDGASETNMLKNSFGANAGADSSYALYDVADYRFASGKSAYFPALGQLIVANVYGNEINELASLLGLSFSGFENARSSSYSFIWSNSQKTWAYNGGSPESTLMNVKKSNYYFCEITEEQCLYTPEIEEYEVLGGKVSFGALRGDEVSIKASAKGDEYRTPDEVHLTVQDGDNNVSLVYNLLVIDTIYINNLIAETSSIISGEMNGNAVQAIWNNVHRYLGKIVTKEDSTNELVLLDIDQNDNRYYTDGSMIELEALGTNAYFFTKIPAMSYKITQMSENIYKVQISYKYKPEGDGWKHFDELIVPTFNYANIGGKNKTPTFRSETAFTSTFDSFLEGFKGVNIHDYSNIALLLYAKYGVNVIENIENYNIGNFISTSTIPYYLNGFSLQNGKKDAKYNAEDGCNFICNLLGIENFVLRMHAKTSTEYSEAGFYNDDKTYPLNFSSDKTINISTDKVKDTINVNFNVSSAKQYIKRLYIKDYFIAVGIDVGGTSDTYYREFVTYNNQSYTMIKQKGLVGCQIYSAGVFQFDRLKFTGNHRIESDRDAFNALTNIWV